MTLYKIYSESCGPCRVLEKNLKEAKLPYEDINANSEIGQEFVTKYNIRSVPTLIMLDDNGNVSKSHIGLMTVSQLKDWFYE